MGPVATEAPKHVYQRPDWIDEEVIKTLSEEKQQYWANRILGNNGQGVKLPEPKVFKESEVEVAFDNQGRMYAKTRAVRRTRPFGDNQYTKATHSLKLARKKATIKETLMLKKAAKKEKKNAEK